MGAHVPVDPRMNPIVSTLGRMPLLPDSPESKSLRKLNEESKVLPTTWPRLLMPVANAAKSPGRVRRFVTPPFC